MEASLAIFKIIGAAWILIATMVTLAIVADTSPQAPALPSPRTAVVTDLGESERVQSQMRMLEQMRTVVSPSMNGMIAADPMWLDPDVIRAQEQYQAQLDRMVGRR